MTRLCVIGNSHVVALRAGWDQVPALADVAATYFCSPGITLSCLAVANDTIVPTVRKVANFLIETSGGHERIIPQDYDAVLLVGLQVGARTAWTPYASHRIAAHARRGNVVISDACFAATLDSIIAQSTAAKLIPMLQSVGLRTIYLVPEPSPPEQFARLRRLMTNTKINTFIHESFDAALSRMEQAYGVTVIRQRAETMADGVTLSRYSASFDEIARGEAASTRKILHGDAAFGLFLAQDLATALAVDKRAAA